MIKSGYSSVNESIKFSMDKYLNSKPDDSLRKRVKSWHGAGKFEIYPSMLVWKTKTAYWLRRGSIYTGREDKIKASSFEDAMQKIFNLIAEDARISYAYREGGELKYAWDPVPKSSELYVQFEPSKIQKSEIKAFYDYLQSKNLI